MADGTSYEDTKIETFDDFNESETAASSGTVIPFQFRKKEQSTHEWLMNFWDVSKERSKSRIRHYRRNMYLYKGVHWKGEGSSKRAPKQVVNFINEMVDAKVSSRAKNKVSFQAIPTEYTQPAVNASKGVKKILTSRANQIGLDKKHRSLDRVMFILGHAFLKVDWNPEAGGINRKYQKVKDLGGAALKKFQKQMGTKDSIYNGDVDVTILGANRVFPEIGKEIGIGPDGDVNYCNIVSRVHVEDLRAEFPNADIEPDCSDEFFWRMEENGSVDEYCVRHEFIHRSTKYLLGGKKIIWCNSCILSEEDFQYDHGELNLVEARDTEVYEEYFGRSDIENVYGMQRFYNAIQSFQARDVSFASAPKWMIPKGSVKAANINNELGIMEYSGPTAPKLETFKATPDQGFTIQDRLEGKISKGMKAFDISRGEVPKGITATSALRLIEESEQNVSLDGIANRKDRIIAVYNMMADTMGQYYTASDDRTIRAIGEKNEYMFSDLKDTDFSKFYKVAIEKTSALSDSKAGRISDIVELNQVTQTDPIFKRPEIIEMLSLGLDSGFKDRATIAITSARTILEKMLSGESVPEPQKYDDLIVHRGVLIDALQETAYTGYMAEESIAAVQKRAKVIEFLMDVRCKENLKFANEVALVSDYPSFLKLQHSLGDIIRMHQTGGTFSSEAPPAQDTSKIETIDRNEEV